MQSVVEAIIFKQKEIAIKLNVER